MKLKKVGVDRRPEGDERARTGESWGSSAPGIGNSRCKGSEAGSPLEPEEGVSDWRRKMRCEVAGADLVGPGLWGGFWTLL